MFRKSTFRERRDGIGLVCHTVQKARAAHWPLRRTSPGVSLSLALPGYSSLSMLMASVCSAASQEGFESGQVAPDMALDLCPPPPLPQMSHVIDSSAVDFRIHISVRTQPNGIVRRGPG